MGPEPRPELTALPPAVHGGDAPPGILDFSTGISPLPVPTAILDAFQRADLRRYPHATALPFREAVAELHGILPEQIVAGAGSVELIWALARTFGGPGRTGLIVVPAFGEYQQALRASGTRVTTLSTRAPRFELSFADLERAIDTADPVSIVFVCRPSNPCLSVFPAEAFESLASRSPRTLFVVDEAYQPMFQGVERVAARDNIAVLRSMTKVFALPGLRLGYLLAAPEVARAVQSSLPPWNVSSGAQAAGIVAARLLPTHGEKIRREIADLRDSLARALSTGGSHFDGAGGPFLLYRVTSVETATTRLRAAGVVVRSCASFGLPAHIRIGVRCQGDNAMLISAWGQAIS